jgi:NADPH-dependent curcumin reductase CurA
VTTTLQVRLARRPVGMPDDDTYDFVEEELPELQDGQLLLRVVHLSLDPYMRGRMSDAPSYAEPVPVGGVMVGGTVCQVEESRHPDWKPGEWALSYSGWQTRAISDGSMLRRLDPSLAPPSTALGVLGMPGFTAYAGLLEIGRPKGGETVVVAAATGPVGSAVGQIAKLKGARAVGIAGGPEKCALLTDELGFDAAIDYREGDVTRALHRHCPDGIDVYFDNVGGEILDAALANLARGARVVICGAISQYNAAGGMRGPSNYMMLLVRRARMQGFLVFDYADRYPAALQEMTGWLRDGRLTTREELVRGSITDFPDALMKLFRGENTGKLVLAIASA